MNFDSPSSLVQATALRSPRLVSVANLVLLLGCAILALPTMYEVATKTWTSEQGGHGPLVLATGLWAVWRELKGKDIERRPGKLAIGLPLLGLALGVFILSRISTDNASTSTLIFRIVSPRSFRAPSF